MRLRTHTTLRYWHLGLLNEYFKLKEFEKTAELPLFASALKGSWNPSVRRAPPYIQRKGASLCLKAKEYQASVTSFGKFPPVYCTYLIVLCLLYSSTASHASSYQQKILSSNFLFGSLFYSECSYVMQNTHKFECFSSVNLSLPVWFSDPARDIQRIKKIFSSPASVIPFPDNLDA